MKKTTESFTLLGRLKDLRGIASGTPEGPPPGDGASLEEKLSHCPTSPGVYIMKNDRGHVVYVGKAKNLRARVRSYFHAPDKLSSKTQHLMLQVETLEFLHVPTETEALVLENTLIKKFKPKYNIRLKDDKTYPYLKIDFSHPFPRPYLVRRKLADPEGKQKYFGPFTHGAALRTLLTIGSKVFQVRDCRDSEFANRSRPCLSFEIGQCTAPCVGKVSQDDYARQVLDYVDFLGGKPETVQQKWRESMEIHSEKMEFEAAAKLRDRIRLVEDILAETQSRVEMSDLVDRDFWLAPVQIGDSGEEALCSVFQFRDGKWIGQIPYEFKIEGGFDSQLKAQDSAEETSTQGGKRGFGDDWLQVLFHHYSKSPIPSEVVLPESLKGLDLLVLAQALGTLSRGTQGQEPVDSMPILRFMDFKGEWLRLADLFARNLQETSQERDRKYRDRQNGLIGIGRILDLDSPPKRLECMDISNFQGEGNVASCVVFIDGKPDKSQYRRYHIRGFEGQDDFASLKEVISRRFGKDPSESAPRPDLLVIDGGRGQLGSVVACLKDLGVEIPVVGLAKARVQGNFQDSEVEATEERLFKPGQKNPIKIRDPNALKILTFLRDEAHRFAIEFNRLTLERKRKSEL